MTKFKDEQLLSWAREVLDIEIEGLTDSRCRLDCSFAQAVNVMAACRGRIVITGMGKAGIIGQKFSATLSSTGSSSFWLHAAEAVHGDLGRIREDDVVIVLSYSGETEEIKNLIPFVEKIGAKIIAMTGKGESTLARYADCVLDVTVKKEACALGLAPTTSTTVMLGVCDALAVVLMKMKGFKEKDFALFHPRGSLGRKLLLKVKDIMRKGERNPLVSGDTKVREVLRKITASRAGAAVVVDKSGRIEGIFTDGDLRRSLDKHPDIMRTKIKEVMTRMPVTVKDSDLASYAMKILETKRIDEVPVVDKQGRPMGMLDIQDLVAAGII